MPPSDDPAYLGPDPDCWSEGFDFHTCCYADPRHAQWCWDLVYTPERCCGTELAQKFNEAYAEHIAQSNRFQWPQGNTVFLGLWVFLSLPAILRLLLTDKGNSEMPRSGGSQLLREALELRILATCGLVGFHFGCFGNAKTPYLQFVDATFMTNTDIFYIVSTYLVFCRGPNPCSAGDALIDFGTGILRRLQRTVPVLLLTHLLPWNVFPTDTLNVFLGDTWPFVVEFVCIAFVRCFLGLACVLGVSSAAAAALATLVGCMWRFHQHQILRKAFIDLGKGEEMGLMIHKSIFGTRLPLCLVTVLLTMCLNKARNTTLRTPTKIHSVQSRRITSWFLAICGLIVTGLMEQRWGIYSNKNPTADLSPWWLFPYLTKLPLLLGCLFVLELGEHQRIASEQVSIPSWLVRIESWTLAVNSMKLHWLFAKAQVKLLPKENDLTVLALLFHWPAAVLWSVFAAAILTWVQQPYGDILKWLLQKSETALKAKRNLWRLVLGTILTLPTGVLIQQAVKNACGDAVETGSCLVDR